jgi:hypothetical protein
MKVIFNCHYPVDEAVLCRCVLQEGRNARNGRRETFREELDGNLLSIYFIYRKQEAFCVPIGCRYFGIILEHNAFLYGAVTAFWEVNVVNLRIHPTYSN